MSISVRFVDAVDLARRAHEGQVRKGSRTPYVTHPLAVAGLVLEFGGNEDQAIAGLLHDVLEDCGPRYASEIEREFGRRVMEMVQACTDGRPGEPRDINNWYARKQEYLNRLAGEPLDFLLVSACDKLHNARAIAADYRAIGPLIFKRFRAGRAGTLWYYRELSAIISVRIGGRLAQELYQAVSTFDRYEDEPLVMADPAMS